MKFRLTKYLFLPFFAFFIALISCEEEEEESVILTEGILFLSGERVRLSGRIYSNGGDEVTDHGFEIATSETFDNPILIQNGERATLGAFIGESEQLDSEMDYYYRAYAEINNVVFYGDVKSFLTLTSSLSSFSPQFAYSGEKVTIIGANFSSKTKVFFGENEAEILSIDIESIIEVKVPNVGSSTQVIVKILDDASELQFIEPFEYVFGSWEEVGEFPQNFGFYEAVSLTKDNHFIYGLGVNQNAHQYNTTLWDYDLDSKIWKELLFPGTVVRGAFSNNAGYFGAGAIEWGFEPTPILGNEFWKFENGLISYIGEVPFGLYKAVSFYYNGNVYVTGGLNIEGDTNYAFYMYSESSNSWVVLEDAPLVISQDLPSFTHNSFQYFLNAQNILWKFDIVLEEWTNMGAAPIFVIKEGIAEVIGNKAYIGIYSNNRTFWEYDIPNDFWKEKSRFESNVSYINSGSFVNNETIRLIRVNPNGLDTDRMPIFEFDPTAF